MFGRKQISFLFLASAFIIAASAATVSAKTKDLKFLIEPVVSSADSRFRVSIGFNGDADGTTNLKLPDEWGGQSELYRSVQNLKAKNAVVSDTEKPNEKLLTHEPGQKITVIYELVQDFTGPLKNEVRYRPVIEKDYIHWIGYTVWVLPDWNDKEIVSVSIKWRNLPASWSIANSFATGIPKHKFKISFGSLRGRSITVAGDFRIISTTAAGKPVNVAIRGKWQFADAELAEMIRRVIEMERAFWNDYSQDYYLVTLVPIDGGGPNSYSTGGTGLADSFALFATTNAKIESFRRLLAHEYFHNWNNPKLGRMPEPEQQMYWFSEGFTDFYTYELLRRSGLITQDEYIARYNELIREYYLSPVRTEPNERIIQDFWKDQHVQRLPYLRGFLLATNWNASIKKASGGKFSLDNVMHDLFQASRVVEQPLNKDTFAAHARKYLDRDLSPEIDRFAINGELVVPDASALGPNIELETSQIPIFDIGLDTDALVKKKAIAKVKRDSAAFEAGLRDGQTVVGGFSLYFGDTSREIELKVKDESGVKTVKYLPVARERVYVPQYRLKG